MSNPDIKILVGPKGGDSPSGASAVEIRQALQSALSGKNGVKIDVRLASNTANNLRQEIQKALNANGGIEVKLKGQITEAVSKSASGSVKQISDEVVARKIKDGPERTIANRRREGRNQALAQSKAINKALDEQYRLQQKAAAEEAKAADAAKRAADAEKKKAEAARQTATVVQASAAFNVQNFEKYLQGVSAKGRMDYADQINEVRELYRLAGKDGLRESLQRADSAVRQLKATFKDLGYEGGNIFTYIQNKVKSFMVYLISSKLTNAFIKGVRDGVSAVKDLNTEMTQLRIVTGASQRQMDKFMDTAITKAKNVASSVTDILNSTTVYARLGYSMDESADLAEYTAILQNVGDIDVSSAQDAITAIVKAYDIGSTQIESTMDKMVTVGNNYPISVSQLAEGMNNAGSALSAAGNNLDQSLALLAAANTTVQNISKSSTGLRTIAARIRNTKTELDDLGEAMTDAEYDNLVQSLTKANVSLTDTNGELRSTYDILQDIAKVWGGMSQNDQAAIAETLAGTRQQNIFYSIINQFDEASKAMDAMTSSAGAMSSANSVYMESVGAKADRMKASFQELSNTLLNSNIIGLLYDIGNGALNASSAFDAWPAKIALVAAGLPTLIGLFKEFKHMPLIESIGGSFKDLAQLPMTLSSLGAALNTISSTTTITRSTLNGLIGEFKNLSVQQIAQIALSGEMSKADLFAVLQKAGLTREERKLIAAKLDEAGATGASTAATTADTGAKVANTAATFSLSSALKGLLATTKAFIVANPEVAVLAIITAITAAIVYAAGAQERALKKQREHTEKLKQEYSTLLSEVQSLTNELQTVDDKIDELHSKGSLSFVEQEELSRLEKQNELLAKQIELREKDAADKAKEANESIAEEFKLEYNTKSPKYQSIKPENQVTRTVYAQGTQGTITTGKVITQIELYDELIERAKELDALRQSMSADEWLASGNQLELDWINEQIEQISDGFGALARRVEDADKSGAEAFKTYYDLFKLGQDAQNGIFWSTTANTDFNKVWDDSKFKSVRDKLQALADDGSVTVDILNGDEFKEFLVALGPDLTDTSEKIEDLVSHINSLGVAGSSNASGADSLKKGLAGLSDETTVLRDALAKLGDGSAVFDKWIGSGDNLKNLLDKFPNLRDEIEAYAAAISAGENPQKAFIALQCAMNAALADFNTDAIYDGINDVVSACDTYGASSNKVLQAVQNLGKYIPGLVDKLYDEENGHLVAASGANFSAAAIYTAAKEAIEMEKTAGSVKFDNLVNEFNRVGSAAIGAAGTAAIAIEGLSPAKLMKGENTFTSHLDSVLESLNAAYKRIQNDKSKKSGSVYVPDVDPLYQYLQSVEDINDALDRFDIDAKLLDEDDFEGKNALIEQRIQKLEELKTALHNLNNARDVEISTAVDKLNGYGNFRATYDANSGQALINNMDALKGLTGDTAKAAEALISTIENGSKAAISTSNEYMEALVEQNNLLKKQKELLETDADDRVERHRNAISLLKNQQGVYEGNLDYQAAVNSIKAQKSHWVEIQNIAHQMAEEIRAANPSITDDDPLLKKWIDLYWEAAGEINSANEKFIDDSLARLDSFIRQADNFNWWDNIDTTKVDMLEKKLESIHQLYADGIIQDAATYKKLVDETAKEIYDEKLSAIEKVIDYTKKLIEEEVRLRKEELEEQVSDYKQIVDLKKESLRASKDEADYQKSVAEKTKAIAQLQQQINTLSLSNDRKDVAERKKLEEELAELQGELADAQADHTLEAQEKALDDSYDAFEKEKNDEVKKLEATIDTEGKLYALAIKRIDEDWDALYKDLMQMNSLYWDGIAGEAGIKGAWDTAKQAAEGYKGTLETIQGIEKERAAVSGTGTSVGSSVVSDKNVAYLTGDIDKQKQLQAIGAEMQTNSQMWHTAYNANNKGQMEALQKANQRLADKVEELTGQRPVFDSRDGYWKLGNGEHFYEVYHSGGIVGSDEEFAKLQKGELVVPRDQVEPTMKLLNWGSTLASQMRGLFSGDWLASSAINDAIKSAPTFPAAGTIVNNNTPSFSPNIQVEVKYDGSASPADAKRFGDNIAAGITEAFRRKGIGTGATPLLTGI